MEVIVQGETDFDHRAMGRRTVKPRLGDLFKGAVRQSNVRIVMNGVAIIENKRAFKGVGVDQKNKERQARPHQYFTDIHGRLRTGTRDVGSLRGGVIRSLCL